MTRGIDAHQHIWRLERGDYGWLTPALAPIYRDFTLDDLAPHLAAHRIEATILVQSAPTDAERDRVHQLRLDSEQERLDAAENARRRERDAAHLDDQRAQQREADRIRECITRHFQAQTAR